MARRAGSAFGGGPSYSGGGGSSGRSGGSSGGSSRSGRIVLKQKTIDERESALANQRAAAEKKSGGGSSSSGSSSNPNIESSTASSKSEALEKLANVISVSEGIKRQTAIEKIKERQTKSNSSNTKKEIVKEATTQQPTDKKKIVESQMAPVNQIQPGLISAGPKRNWYQKTEDTLNIWFQDASKPTNKVSAGRIVKGTVGFIGGGALSYAKGIVYDVPKGIYTTIRHPIKTVKGVYKLATDKETRDAAIVSVGTNFAANPSKSIGSGAAILTAPKVYGKATNVVKDVYVKVGSTPIDDTAVFSNEVLAGKRIMPLSKGTKSALKQFNKADDAGSVTVQTSSPAKIKGKLIGTGRKVGLEDPGVYVTPAGEGSPYFLRVDPNVAPTYSYSLNPFKDTFGVPTVTRFKINKVVTYPKSALKKPGFSHLKDVQKANIGKGQAYITKRSMIGQGELPSKSFKAPVNLKLDSMKVKAGQLVKEAGTSEIEAVIGTGEKFSYTPKTTLGKIKGFDYYTKFQGRAVAVRDAKLLTSQTQTSNVIKSVTLPSRRIASEASAVSSISTSTVTPYPAATVFSSIISSKFPKQRLNSVSSTKRTPNKQYSIKTDVVSEVKPATSSNIGKTSQTKISSLYEKSSKKSKTSFSKSSKKSSGTNYGGSSPSTYRSSVPPSSPYSSSTSKKSSKTSSSKKSSSSSTSGGSSYFSSFSNSRLYSSFKQSYYRSYINSKPNLLTKIPVKIDLKPLESGILKKKKKKVKQLKGLTPTATAAVFEIKGKTQKESIVSGLGQRFI